MFQKRYATMFALACLMLSSCATFRANMFLINETSPQAKADLLFQEGKKRYTVEVLEKNEISSLPEIRRYFTDALAVDPLNPEAANYIDSIDSFKAKKFDAYKATAQKLYATEKRTPVQDYDLVYASQMALVLDGSDKDIARINKDIKATKAAVILTREERLAAVQKQIEAEIKQQDILKELRDADRLIKEIENVDPGNGTAKSARDKIAEKTDALVQKDVDEANKALGEKKYGSAEEAILRAERNLAAISREPGERISGIKYRIYYDWSLSLYNARNYRPAGDRITSALRVNRAPEAVSLKTKINKAMAAHDFDADIAEILASVDACIARNDTAGAMELIEANLPKLKVQSNRDKLAAKKDAVQVQLKTVYQAGISLYNEEDYEGARQKFRAVLAIDAGYEQAQAYLDRTLTKIRALSGND